eukprot:TRINITY_DN8038_c0_g1_i1.p1 TRINITY_DN8038_c0_g1~~TRINITY_DN8038_c0_g1_i1.p1  ORF type:complete len:151 (+),score=16.91 TRINITY_DN8038_c0_g1_i1:131-583(+)
MCIRDRYRTVGEWRQRLGVVRDGGDSIPQLVFHHELCPLGAHSRMRTTWDFRHHPTAASLGSGRVHCAPDVDVELLAGLDELGPGREPVPLDGGCAPSLSPTLPPSPIPPYLDLSLIHISEPTRLLSISYAVFCLKKKNKNNIKALLYAN